MKNIQILAAFLIILFYSFLIAQEETALPENDSCINCHIELDYMPEGFSKNDIHMQEGLSCAGCHGGNPNIEDEEKAMSKSEGFIGVPSKEDIPELCGKCHSDINFMRKYQPRISTDQLSQYYTSVHGQKLKEGDEKVADCVSCHSSHMILTAKDPRSTVHALNVPGTCKNCHSDTEYMEEYGIPSNQFEEYALSVHGKALLENRDTGAPACNDCHGNHGATPPGIASVSHVCGTCHYNNMEFFSKTKMARQFEEQNIHGCEACHGYHKVLKTSIDMIGTHQGAVCSDCHNNGDNGYKAAKSMRNSLEELSTDIDSLSIKKNEVERIGMDDVEINFMLQEAKQNFIKAKTLVHTFDSTIVKEETQKGVTKIKEASLLAAHQIKEHQTRRLGFGVTTVLITVLVIALYFKIKEMEK